MLKKIGRTLEQINPWHFVWISVVSSELFSAGLNALQSWLLWGSISIDLLKIGAIDALFVPLIVAPLAIYFVRHTAELRTMNDRLLHEAEVRRQVENALLSSESRYRVIVQNQAEFVVRYLPGGILTFINDTLCSYLNMKREDLLGKSYFPFLHDEDRESFVRNIESLDTRNPSITAEARVVLPDGRTAWHKWSHSAIFDDRGAITEYQATGRDVTESKRMEEALRESEERYRRLFETESDAIFMMESDGSRIIDANPAAEKLYGYSREEFQRMGAAELSSDPERTRQSILDQDTQIPLRMHRRKDGAVFAAQIKVSFFDYQGRKVLVAAIRDISELQRAEEEKGKLEAQLLQSQKMEAIGQLAGGVAHDFNNVLTAIIGYGSILEMKMAANDPLRINVDQILESAGRAAQLTHSLLAFSRKQVLNMKPTRLNRIVAGQEKFLRRIIGEDIEMKTILRGDTVILADGGQIEQVLMNLATNARDAMPKGGKLIIETDLLEMTEAFIHTHGFGQRGSYAVISVTDTGTGMDEETKQKIFEPFFTTKEVGRGTGLGMAIVYGIINQHKGYINVNSQVGRGTTFTIYLPVHSGLEETGEMAAARMPVDIGTETILLAEDDATLRTFFRNILIEHGYTVIVAEDGEEAIRKFVAWKDDVRLCVVDMIMPKKSGKEVYEAIQKVKPGMKVLFSSGYTAEKVLQEDLPAASEFVAKPASPREYLNKIRGVLDSTAQQS